MVNIPKLSRQDYFGISMIYFWFPVEKLISKGRIMNKFHHKPPQPQSVTSAEGIYNTEIEVKIWSF